MSNSSFSPVPDDASDPPVDQELRDFMQRFAVGPTLAEQDRFWADLSEKLPEQKVSARLFARPGLKRYLPWTALASGVAVILLLWVVPSGQHTERSVAEPMILGAAPVAKQRQSTPFGLTSPDFTVRWEPVSERVFRVYVLAKDRERFLNLAKAWPEGLQLTEVAEPSVSAGTDAATDTLNEKQWVYRLEDKR